MYRALARFIRSRSAVVAGTCLAVGGVIAAPALAAHMAGTQPSRSFDDVSSSTLEPRGPEQLHAGGRTDSPTPSTQTSPVAVGLSDSPAPEKSQAQEVTSSPDHEVMTDSIGDFSDFASPGVAAPPAEPRSVNARIPGVSDGALARFKKRMYRKDI